MAGNQTAVRSAPSEGVIEPSHVGHRQRITSLDGLRGVAALIVVSCHTVVASVRSLSLQNHTATTHLPRGSVSWWLAFTPLHIVYDGEQSVVVFFVLSGFVLALPAVKLGGRWLDASYYPRRLVRLYLPVWGALAFAVLMHDATSRAAVPGAALWLNEHAATMTIKHGLGAAALVHQGGDPAFISVLWSLRWEVYFSLLLPLFLAFAIVTRRRPRVACAGVAASFVLIAWGAHSNLPFFRYMPMFMLGSLMAFHQDAMDRWARASLARLGAWRWNVGLPVLLLLLLTSEDWAFGFGDHHVALLNAVTSAAVSLGACLAIFLAAHHARFSSVLSSRPAHWLGSRSYSLYLIHEPLLVTIAFAMGGRPNVALFLLIVIPSALLVAELFWRAVENPAIGVARWTGQQALRLRRRLRPWAPSPEVPSA